MHSSPNNPGVVLKSSKRPHEDIEYTPNVLKTDRSFPIGFEDMPRRLAWGLILKSGSVSNGSQTNRLGAVLTSPQHVLMRNIEDKATPPSSTSSPPYKGGDMRTCPLARSNKRFRRGRPRIEVVVSGSYRRPSRGAATC